MAPANQTDQTDQSDQTAAKSDQTAQTDQSARTEQTDRAEPARTSALPYRIVVAKPGLDGHDRGVKVIARALRDAGFEVIYTGLFQTPEQVAETALQEDADAVGLCILSGAHMTLFPRVVDELRTRGLDDVLVFGGGIIPDADIARLKDAGVAAIFTPGAPMATITDWLRGALDGARDHVNLYRVPGQAVLRPLRHPRLTGRGGAHVDEAVAAAERVGYPVVVKAQVQVGGRGKAGGIKLAGNADEIRAHAEAILGMDIKGHIVELVWIEHASDIAEEYYASFTLDRSAKQHLGMLSAEGGVDIEAVAADNPEAIARIHVDPVDGLSEDQARAWVRQAKLNPAAEDGAVDILLKLYRSYVEGDADLVEVNPLILTTDGQVHALDAKVTLDGNAVFRHPTTRSTTPPRCATTGRSWPTRRACSTSASTGPSA